MTPQQLYAVRHPVLLGISGQDPAYAKLDGMVSTILTVNAGYE